MSLKRPFLALSGHLNFAPPRTSELSFDKGSRGSILMSILWTINVLAGRWKWRNW